MGSEMCIRDRDRATNKEQSMTITGQSSLDNDVIDQMVRDAEAHAEEDSRRRSEAEARNNADSLVYQTEKLLRDQGDKFEGDEKVDVESKLADLKTSLAGEDIEEIKDKTEALMTASQGFSQRLYEEASAQNVDDNPDFAEPTPDDVVDAEIIEDSDAEDDA